MRGIRDENQKVGVLRTLTFVLSLVFPVQATDGDVGSFGVVRYSFTDDPDQ